MPLKNRQQQQKRDWTGEIWYSTAFSDLNCNECGKDVAKGANFWSHTYRTDPDGRSTLRAWLCNECTMAVGGKKNIAKATGAFGRELEKSETKEIVALLKLLDRNKNRSGGASNGGETGTAAKKKKKKKLMTARNVKNDVVSRFQLEDKYSHLMLVASSFQEENNDIEVTCRDDHTKSSHSFTSVTVPPLLQLCHIPCNKLNAGDVKAPIISSS